MEAELSALEQKLGELATLCQRLRTDNKQLRQDLAHAINDNKQLSEKVSSAKARLESLLAKIPADD